MGEHSIDEVEIGDLKFRDEKVHTRTRGLYLFTKDFVPATWHHQGLHARSEKQTFWEAWWVSPGVGINEHGSFGPNSSATFGDVLQTITIHVHRDRSDKKAIESLKLMANLWQHGEGWSAEVRHFIPRGKGGMWPTFDFSIYYRNPANVFQKGERTKVRLATDLTRAGAAREFDSTLYIASVKVAKEDNIVWSQTTADDQIACWFTSAESFRDAALARLIQLEGKFEVGMRSGKIIEARHTDGSAPFLEFREPGDKKKNAHNSIQNRVRFVAWRPPPAPSSRRLSKAELELLRQDGLHELDKRKKFVQQKYKEMHAALVAAFPLHRFLQKSTKKK